MTDQNNDPTPPPSGYSQPAGASQPDPYAPQGGYAQPAYGAPAYGAPAPSKTLSIIAMIAGIVGLVSFGWFALASIAALILGYMGRKREGAPARGFWLTGIITGWVGVGLTVLVVGGFILFAIIGASAGGYDRY